MVCQPSGRTGNTLLALERLYACVTSQNLCLSFEDCKRMLRLRHWLCCILPQMPTVSDCLYTVLFVDFLRNPACSA